MTEKEALKLTFGIKSYFPSFWADIAGNNDEISTRIKAWHAILKDYDYLLAEKAVIAFATNDTKGFPPTVGQIIDQIQKLKAPKDQMTELDAWKMVRKALRNDPEQAREQFEKLPPILQRTLGSANTLREWAMMSEETLDSVVQSNFMRSYKAKATAEHEYEVLPNSVKQVTAQMFKALPEDQK